MEILWNPLSPPGTPSVFLESPETPRNLFRFPRPLESLWNLEHPRDFLIRSWTHLKPAQIVTISRPLEKPLRPPGTPKMPVRPPGTPGKRLGPLECPWDPLNTLETQWNPLEILCNALRSLKFPETPWIPLKLWSTQRLPWDQCLKNHPDQKILTKI